jgi:hypothetical protein
MRQGTTAGIRKRSTVSVASNALLAWSKLYEGFFTLEGLGTKVSSHLRVRYEGFFTLEG